MDNGMKIGLSLSGGAMRGLAHIGVLEVLEEHDIPVHMIAGTSMGSVVGAIYASGTTPGFLRSIAESVTPADERKYVDLTVPKMGMIRGSKIERVIRTLTAGKKIEELNIPYVAVACCVEDNEVVYYDQGNLVRAVRASIAIPGIFEPLVEDGKTYVDGGVLERLPVKVLRKMGADYIIAVDVNPRGGHNASPKSIFDLLFSVYSMMEWQAMEHRTSDADATILPQVDHVNPATFRQAKECIDLGRQAAEDVVDDIKMQLSMMGYSFNKAAQ